MAGANEPISRRPAHTVGGQRRRLARRPCVPRSNTTPVLNAAFATGFTESSDSPGLGTNPREGATIRHTEEGANTLESSQSMMNFYPPTGIPADLRLTCQDRLPAPSNASPTLSASSATTDNKKKHGLKIKDIVRGSNKQLPQPPQPTPLPPSTPTKAAKLLGVTYDVSGVSGSPRAVQHDGPFDGFGDGRPRVKYGWPQQHSAPDLTAWSNTVTSKFREEDINADIIKAKEPKGFWGSSKRAARKIIGKDQDGYPLQDYQWPEPPEPPEVHDRPVPAAHSRRGNKRKGRQVRELHELMPITETSHDDMSGAYREDEDNTELDVIAEYTHDIPPCSASLLPRSHAEPLITAQRGPYELDDKELSSTEDDTKEIVVREKKKERSVDLNEVKWQYAGAVYLRSPLQNVEDRFLDVAEEKLKHTQVKEDSPSPDEDDYSVHGSTIELSKAKQPAAAPTSIISSYEDYKMAATEEDFTRRKAALDIVVEGLRRSQQKMKNDFDAIKNRQEAEEESDIDDDLPSVRSSIDLDEEPTVHVATAMAITKVTPGMVKLINVPPRKKYAG